MSEARIDRISNENNTGGPTLSGITTFSGQNYFVPPRGTTAERPSDCPPGSIRFNTDGAHLEYFDGLQWLELEAFNNELGVNGGLGHRGLFGGGDNPADQSRIDYITISTLGNSISFGNLTDARTTLSACASSTRGLFCGGYFPTEGIIDFVTISSTGNATSFGNLTQHRLYTTSLSSSTRGITGGGLSSPSPALTQFNIIDYVTIASTGNSVDFGDLTQARGFGSSFSSTTRGVFGGGQTPTYVNTIDYITISTTGNAVDFGDLLGSLGQLGGCSNATRGIFAGGVDPAFSNVIQYITIATTGNTQDFGDLTLQRRTPGGCASPIRGVFIAGGVETSPFRNNTIDYVTIMTTGNAQDFGDLNTSTPPTAAASCSNGHGGL